MTCKDCLCSDVCIETRDQIQMLAYQSRNDVEKVCSNFKDKSRFVELPCKVGDTLYKVWYLPCHNGETYSDSYNCSGCEDECDLKKTIFEFKVPSIQFIVNELLKKDNRVYYITREEAEKALRANK